MGLSAQGGSILSVNEKVEALFFLPPQQPGVAIKYLREKDLPPKQTLR
jgi:hypothetical protein